jgi:predicted nucleic acid-binding protein
MRIAVSNSSPLILLAKTRALDILTHFFDVIYIPSYVHHEVVEEGMINGYADALLVKNLVDSKKIIVKSNFPHALQSKGIPIHGLHPGEVDAIDLALSFKGNTILLDDEEARKIARALGLVVKGTLGLLIDYNKAGKMDKDQALKKLEELNKLMYLSGDVYHIVESSFV